MALGLSYKANDDLTSGLICIFIAPRNLSVKGFLLDSWFCINNLTGREH